MSKPWFANHGQKLQTAFAFVSTAVTLSLGLSSPNLPSRVHSALWPVFYGSLGMIVLLVIQQVWPKAVSAEPISTPQPELLALLDAHLEEQDDPKVFFSRKLRVIVNNVSGKDLVVGPGTRWLTDRNDIKLQPLPHPVWELEGPRGWHAGSWIGNEKIEINVAPGRAVRTWIGLHATADKDEVRRHTVTRSLGTLVVPIKIDGVVVEQRFRL
jgi:hypothetical protein